MESNYLCRSAACVLCSMQLCKHDCTHIHRHKHRRPFKHSTELWQHDSHVIQITANNKDMESRCYLGRVSVWYGWPLPARCTLGMCTLPCPRGWWKQASGCHHWPVERGHSITYWDTNEQSYKHKENHLADKCWG